MIKRTVYYMRMIKRTVYYISTHFVFFFSDGLGFFLLLFPFCLKKLLKAIFKSRSANNKFF